MVLRGFASPAGTAAYAASHAGLDYRSLSRTGLQVSQAGFGCYRIDVAVPEHHAALRQALLGGINLVDTSANYADGDSETLVGAVLEELVSSDQLAREQVVVVTKAGYLQGQNYALSQQRKARGEPFPELVEVTEGLEHCIHPEFLADQLDRSLVRLQLETVDVFLLHNPEYYLTWASEAGIPLTKARTEYARRIADAFAYLETEVARGRIRWYGVSSNTFVEPADLYSHTSLAMLWAAAARVGNHHHFAVIQLPFNLYERGAVLEENNPGPRSVLKTARELELGVLVNRPLNAVVDGQLQRLVEVPAPPPAELHPEDALAQLAELESAFETRFLPQLDVPAQVAQQLARIFSTGQMLQWRWQGLGSYAQWQDLRQHYLGPHLEAGVRYLAPFAQAEPALDSWLAQYVEQSYRMFAALEADFAGRARAQAEALKGHIAEAAPEWAMAARLSQIAVRALRTTPGVTSVLVGMRQPEYVADVLEELSRPAQVTPRRDSWERFVT